MGKATNGLMEGDIVGHAVPIPPTPEGPNVGSEKKFGAEHNERRGPESGIHEALLTGDTGLRAPPPSDVTVRFGRHCESFPIGVLIAEGSPDFRCAYANRVLRRLIEPRALPIEGRPLAEVLEMAEKAVLETLRQADSELLTTREWEVAGLVAQGLANKAIAHRLYLSRATIASHVAKILHKLGFDSRVQIAAWVVERRMTSRSF